MTGKTLAAVRMAAATGATLIVNSQEAADHTHRIARELGLTVKVQIVGPGITGKHRTTVTIVDEYEGTNE